MKPGWTNALFWWCLTALVAVVLARIVTLVNARISWPLIILLGAGGLGLAARGLAELCGVRPGVFTALGLITAVLILTATQHVLSWRDYCELHQRASAAKIERAIKQHPDLARLLPDPPPPRALGEFLRDPPGGQAATWSFWGIQALLEQAVAMLAFWAWSYVASQLTKAESPHSTKEPPA